MRPASRSFSAGELIAILSVGLVLGSVVAALVLVEVWILVPSEAPVAAIQTAPPGVTVIPAAAAVPGGVLRTQASPARLVLPSGAIIVLAPDSELTLSALPAPDSAVRATWLTLGRGRVLVSVTPGEGESFFVALPTGLVVQVTGSLMGTGFDSAAARYNVDCLEHSCQFGDDPDHTGNLNNPTALAGGQSVSSDGGISNECRNDEWRPIAEDLVPPCGGPPTETATSMPETSAVMTEPSAAGTETPTVVTLTPMATATVKATVSSFCATQRARFPGTPCP